MSAKLRKVMISYYSCVTKVFLGLNIDKRTSETVESVAKRMNYSFSKIEIDRNRNLMIEQEIFSATKAKRPTDHAKAVADNLLLDKIRSLIVEYSDVHTEQIMLNSRLIDDLKWDTPDSICHPIYVDISTALEDKYNIYISDEELFNWVTVQDIFDCVSTKIWY